MIRTIAASARTLKQLTAQSKLISRCSYNTEAISRLLSTKPKRSTQVVASIEETMLEIVNPDAEVAEVEEEEPTLPPPVVEKTRRERAMRPPQMNEEALEGTVTEGARMVADRAREFVSQFRPSLVTTSEGQLVTRRGETLTVSELRMEEIKESLHTSKADREEKLDNFRAMEAADQSMAALEHNPNYPFSLDGLTESTQTARIKTEVAGGTVQKKKE